MTDIRKGNVIAVPMADKEIVSGAVAVLDNLGVYSLCTVEHLTPEGEWFIQYNQIHGPVPPDAKLCLLMVEEIDTQEKWPLKLNQWKASIKAEEINSDKVVSFEVIPVKFAEGFYNQICSTCNSSFVGGKRQPLCRECCEEYASAKIITGQKTPRKKKEKRYPEQVVMSAFVAGSLGNQDWETWKKNNLK